MVQAAVLLRGAVDRVLALTKNNIVVAELEAGLRRSGESPDILQTEDFTVELFRLFQIIHRNRPVHHRIEFQHSHDRPPSEFPLAHSLYPVHNFAPLKQAKILLRSLTSQQTSD